MELQRIYENNDLHYNFYKIQAVFEYAVLAAKFDIDMIEFQDKNAPAEKEIVLKMDELYKEYMHHLYNQHDEHIRDKEVKIALAIYFKEKADNINAAKRSKTNSLLVPDISDLNSNSSSSMMPENNLLLTLKRRNSR